MNSSEPIPALPTWIFIATDLAFIATAGAIAYWSPHPLSAIAVLWIVVCVFVGAVVGLVPLVLNYERQKNRVLDERQHALEGLARTLGSSADQISIAAKGLHDMADVSLKNLRLAEQLPHKLQDKIAEFQSQLAVAEDAEKEELERELLSLRTSESERLESVSQRIAKSSAEWAKLEAATQQHLQAANEALAKLSLGTANAIGKAQAAAEQALAQARVEAARALGETSGNAIRAVEAARSAALADLERKLAPLTALLDRLQREANRPHADEMRAAPAAPAVSPTSLPPEPVDSSAANAENGSTDQPNAGGPFAPKRPRKLRRDEPTAVTTAGPISPATPAPVAMPNIPASAPATPSLEDSMPIPVTTIPEITPIAPPTAEPFSGHIASISNGSASPVASAPAPAVAAPEPRPSKKRVMRKAEAEPEPGLGLALEDAPGEPVSAKQEPGLASDGATRLLVTAYIGIGNRLFIRGQGPGLTWEKGVPLQFVSIGKWRWETNDATAPVEFKLYKNDDLECSTLGALSLQPGQQQEVTAAF